MLTGAMDALVLGDPWLLATDSGPVIDAAAHKTIADHVAQAQSEGRVLKALTTPAQGHFIAPTLISVSGITDLHREIFGPVLHVARFRSADLDKVIADINGTGYGLTFGLHTRIDDRVQHVTDAIHAGNIYVNRNQIGAIVGSQPFGGEGLSGTGPKAGGPNYMTRFCKVAPQTSEQGDQDWTGPATGQPTPSGAKTPVSTRSLPGPTGESNRLSLLQRAPVLCLGPGAKTARDQADAVERLGGLTLVPNGAMAPDQVTAQAGISGAIWWGDDTTARQFEQALARRDGPILPLITGMPDQTRALAERHVCVDTTAAGGNAALLGGSVLGGA